MLIGLKRARVLLLTIGESDSIRKSDRKIPPESICDLQTAIARSNLHEQLPDIQQASANVTQVHYRFHPHLSEKDIIAGLKLSVLVQGELKVADFDTESAWISINSFDGKRETTVLIRNLCDRNRAMVGDTVVVRVNPKSMWHGNSSEMLIMQHERKDSEEEGNDNSETMDTAFVSFPGLSCTSASELVPTGVVVAITTRRNSEIIATFPQLSRENVVAHKAEEYVLVIPIDRKLPKIRVFTRQAQSLQGKRAVVNIDKTFFKI
jgi:exosome complex exonuclease DIS3/RRP44